MMLSSQKKMARDAVGRKQSMSPRVVVEPRLITFPHTNAAVSAVDIILGVKCFTSIAEHMLLIICFGISMRL